ncbi:MAG TPA: archease [Acidobacteriota bacterium]|nr:archease [Acidobacteriota bacterium]
MQTDMPGKYRFLDHPADLMIEGTGRTMEESWSHVILAAATQIIGEHGTPVQKTITVQAARLQSLLFDLLSDIIARVDVKKFVPTGVLSMQIQKPQTANGMYSVTCVLAGRIVETIENPIKAVTYHQMNIQLGAKSVSTTVVFDI